MAFLILQRSMNVKNLLTSFITDIVINDAFMEHKVNNVKHSLKINQQYQMMPFCDLQPPSTTTDANYYGRLLLSGSFAEGLSVPPIFGTKCRMDITDFDIIRVIPLLTCDIKSASNKATFLVNTQYTHSGYCHLIYDLNDINIDHMKIIQSMTAETLQPYSYADDGSLYCFPSSPLPQSRLSVIDFPNVERHGPAQQVDLQFITSGLEAMYSFDSVIALHCLSWPSQEWIERQRLNDWPTAAIIQDIVKRGCHLVPVAHATSPMPNIEWRYSFSLAELILAKEIPYYTRKTYIMFKLLCKKYLNNYFPLKTYYLKTILFWCCEECSTLFMDDKETLIVTVENIATKLDRLIGKLLNSVLKQELPSYFIRTNNLFDSIDPEYFSESKMKTIIEKIIYLKENPMRILYQTILKHNKLDHCLPFYFSIRRLFKPILKYLYNSVDGVTLKHDCEKVIEQLSISLFLEGKPYCGRKLLQTIWYTLLERLPQTDLEAGNLITEHEYYSLVYNQFQKSLLDRMIRIQEKLLKYFASTDDGRNSNQNILLLRSLSYLHCIKSCVPKTANRDIELNYFRKAFLRALDTTINLEEQQIRCYLAYALYFCHLERYEQALVFLKKVITFEYNLFNKSFITIYSIHKPIHSKDIQHLLHIYNAINISMKTYILYLLCRAYKFTNQYIEGCEALVKLIEHIHEIKDYRIGQYLLGQLYLLYDKIEQACHIFVMNLCNEFELSSIFEPSKTMVVFKASLVITTFLQLNLKTSVTD